MKKLKILIDNEEKLKGIVLKAEQLELLITYYISYGQVNYLLREYLKSEVCIRSIGQV